MRRIHLHLAEGNEVYTLTEDELIALEKLVIREIIKCEARGDDWGVRHYTELHKDVLVVKGIRRRERVNG